VTGVIDLLAERYVRCLGMEPGLAARTIEREVTLARAFPVTRASLQRHHQRAREVRFGASKPGRLRP
jgi:hypothetical protein